MVDCRRAEVNRREEKGEVESLRSLGLDGWKGQLQGQGWFIKLICSAIVEDYPCDFFPFKSFTECFFLGSFPP